MSAYRFRPSESDSAGMAEPNEAVAGEIQETVRRRLGAHEYPREIEFVDALPMTVTGKIIRKELKARAIKELEVA